VYAGAGAYILTDLIDEIFSEDEYVAPFLIPPFITGYNHYYNLGLRYEDIYLGEFVKRIDTLYDVNSNNTIYQLYEIIPEQLDLFLTPSFINEMKNKSHKLYPKLAENNLTNFAPRNKLFIFHSLGDDYIPFSIAEKAYKFYKTVGGNVELVASPGNADHSDTYLEFINFVVSKIK